MQGEVCQPAVEQGRIAALLFDKDGTLFDFAASWNAWTRQLIARLGGGDPTRMAALASAIGFDPETGRFAKGSAVIAGTPEDVTRLLLPELPDWDRAGLETLLATLAEDAQMVPAADLAPLLDRLAARGLTLGVATNDAESAARQHLAEAGVLDRFAFLAGYDSGFGAKPGGGMCTAFAEATGIAPGRIAMIGDSTHDLDAARAAGLCPIGVLTGPAGCDELAPLAEAVLPSIADLPAWLDARGNTI